MGLNYSFGVETAAGYATVSFCKIINVQNCSKVNTELIRRKYGGKISSPGEACRLRGLFYLISTASFCPGYILLRGVRSLMRRNRSSFMLWLRAIS